MLTGLSEPVSSLLQRFLNCGAWKGLQRGREYDSDLSIQSVKCVPLSLSSKAF